MPPIQILSWTSPVDGGGGNPGRTYLSPDVPAGFDHLFTVVNPPSTEFSGALSVGVAPGRVTQFFNRYPQPLPPYQDQAQNQSFRTQTGDTLIWQTNNGGAGAQIFVQLWGDIAPATVLCQYGTQPQPTAPATAQITADLISLILAPVELEWLGPIFGVIFGYWVETGPLCSTLPPATPVIDLSTLNATWQTAFNIFQWVAWPYFCQCSPGTPNPTPPNPPTAIEPPGWPGFPVIPCDNTDLCSAVVRLQQDMNVILDNMQTIGQLVTLLQRYGLPFGVVTGPTHGPVNGTGTIAISRLIGVRIAVTQFNAPQRVLFGNPPYQWDLGWLSVSDGGSMLQEQRINRAQFEWYPRDSQLATVLGYALLDGVAITITELEAET